jgi:hexulose-6-phosphate isomerase
MSELKIGGIPIEDGHPCFFIAIMQGRLSPPSLGRIQCFPAATWQAEFARASEAGLQAIEWVYDVEDAETNPIGHSEGLEEMRRLSKKHGIKVQSLCADYFMPFPFVRASESEWEARLGKLAWLLDRCRLAGIQHVVLPFVDNSRIESDRDRSDVLRLLQRIKGTLERLDMEIHLETSLGPVEFRSLLDEIAQPRVRINYDSGNSASLGFSVDAEWAVYGNFVGSVHIKDRLKGGTTVPLGSGNADFAALARNLKRFNYHGRFVLQVARGKTGDEVNWALANRSFVEKLLAQSDEEARRP